MTDFKSFDIPEFLVTGLTQMGINAPTEVQAQAIPLALTGKDLLVSAQTGTGKTVAYLVPILANLAQNHGSKAVVLAPTRELAAQIKEAAFKLLQGVKGIYAALLIGGDSMHKQLDQLKRAPRLIIGTPGRINDHLKRGSLSLKSVSIFVLDETDRMLDMGFSEQLDEIVTYVSEEHQTLMFSATMPHNIVSLSKKYLNNPERITIGHNNTAAPKIKQDVIHTSENEKFTHLLKELEARTGSVIVFVKTKRGADELASMLRDHSHGANAIHGDLQQSRRDRVILGFRNGKYRILVATDVAARGLDVPHIEHVINFDLPMLAEDYIHRIGRTGRAGAEGSALSFIAPDDKRRWALIARLMDPTAKPITSRENPYAKRSSFGASSGSRPNRFEDRNYGPSRSREGFKDSSARSDGRSDSRSDNRSDGRSDGRSDRGSFAGRSSSSNAGGKSSRLKFGPFKGDSFTRPANY